MWYTSLRFKLNIQKMLSLILGNPNSATRLKKMLSCFLRKLNYGILGHVVHFFLLFSTKLITIFQKIACSIFIVIFSIFIRSLQRVILWQIGLNHFRSNFYDRSQFPLAKNVTKIVFKRFIAYHHNNCGLLCTFQ